LPNTVAIPCSTAGQWIGTTQIKNLNIINKKYMGNGSKMPWVVIMTLKLSKLMTSH